MKKETLAICIGLVVVCSLLIMPPIKPVHAQASDQYYNWGVNSDSSLLSQDQAGSIELGSPGAIGRNAINGATPYIDFHYGNGLSQDFNYRVINSGDGTLSFVSPVSTPLVLEGSSIQVNRGVDTNGSGIKHVSSNASCQTYQYNGNYCTVTINWPGTPFIDTAYDVVCSTKNGAYGSNSNTPSGYILYVPDSGRTTTSIDVNIQVDRTTNGGGLITLSPGITCIAMHG